MSLPSRLRSRMLPVSLKYPLCHAHLLPVPPSPVSTIGNFVFIIYLHLKMVLPTNCIS